MAARLIILALCVAAVVGAGAPGAKYPAGVDPRACPNYPYCHDGALAAYGAGHHGAIAPYAAANYAAYGHHGVGVHGGAGAKYPAGVNPHTCPNYPYCHNNAGAAHGWAGAAHGLAGQGWAGGATYGHGWTRHGWTGAYGAPAWGHGVVAAHHGAHHGAGAHYPAGVDPHSCPNYPYCHNGAVHGAHGWAGVH